MMSRCLWRRLDVPGHDACELTPIADGWRLAGTSVFLHQNGPARIEYVAECDSAWVSRRGEVRGWIASDSWNVTIERSDGGIWYLNGWNVPELEGCLDLDFGFTPATNLLQLRRCELAVGQVADVPAAWIELPEVSLTLLPQRYTRRSDDTYWYESPATGYEALLEIDESGFTRHYPGLWLMER
jgi:hypothetical protein